MIMEMRHLHGQKIPVSVFFAVPKDCTVRDRIFSCREQDCRGNISRSTGRLYLLRVLLSLEVWRNGQQMIKCGRSLETNQRL